MTVSRYDHSGSPLRALGAAVLALATLGGLAWAGPDLGDLERMLGDPQGYVDAVGADRAAVALVGVAGWVLLAWLSVGLLLTAAGTMPGLTGRIFGLAARCVVPAVLRRAVTVALGVSVVTGAAAYADPTAIAPPPAGRFTVAVDWPVAPANPANAGDPSDAQPTEPAGQGGGPEPAPAAQPADPGPAEATVVEQGDTLWGIAATRLGPAASAAEVAASMRAWYAANHEVIGADPDLIRPGQVLVAPPGGPP